MSSVSMILETRKIHVAHNATNPGSLNTWLTEHGGYVYGDDIIWNSVHTLGKVRMLEDVKVMSSSQVHRYLDKCYGVVVNVRHGTHWVLLTVSLSI
jgi:hypothetical protein